mgnify:CR=1 FL=1
MKHYKNSNGQVFGFEDDQLHLVTSDMVEITLEEIAELNKPTPEQLEAQAKAEALRYLADTDWYVVRLTETGVAIPEEVSIKRAEARAIL